MATDIIYSATTDAWWNGNSTTYSTARSTGVGGINSTTTIYVGQLFATPNYSVYEGFISFDTAYLTSGAVISAATLSLYPNADVSTTDFVIQARVRDWGATSEYTDYVAGASLSGLTLVATYNTSSGWVADGYKAFTDVALPANINRTGVSRFVLSSDRQAAGTTPTGNEYIISYSADATGTTNDPKLSVTYTIAHSAAVTLTGGGVVTTSRTAHHNRTAVLTGGGVVTYSATKVVDSFFVAVGTAATTVNDTGTMTPGIPVGTVVNDILFLFIVQELTSTLPTPSGWTQVAGSPWWAGGAAAHKSGLWWKVATGSDSAPSWTNTDAQHSLARIAAFRGLPTTGNPWNVLALGNDNTSSSGFTIDAITTTVPNTFVFAGAGVGSNAGAGIVSSSNAVLTNFTVRTDIGVNALNADGGLVLWTGNKAVAGATGDITVEASWSSGATWFTVALKPSNAREYAATLTGGGTVTSTRVKAAKRTQVLTGGGVAVIARTSARHYAAVLTGGGVIAYTADKSERHSGTATLTGGGVVTVARTAAHKRVQVLTGGGVITIVRTGAHKRTQILTGGGVVTYVRRKAALHAAVLTGGGVVHYTAVTVRGPRYISAGTSSSAVNGGGTVAPGLPGTTQQDDILILFIGCSGPGISSLSGWTIFPGMPLGSGGLNTSYATAFWMRRGASNPTAPTWTNTLDYTTAKIFAFRGCPITGNPWDGTQPYVDGDGADNTSLSLPGVTTGLDSTLVVTAATIRGTAGFSSAANASLVNFTSRGSVQADSSGADGGFQLWTGEKAVAGATGTTTATSPVVCSRVRFTLALKAALKTTADYHPLLHGGGVVTVARSAAHKRVQVLTGGGVVVAAQKSSRRRAVTLTGGGTIVASGHNAPAVLVTLTGGGTVVTARVKGAQASVSLTGGGSIIALSAFSVALTGGGAITVTATTDHQAHPVLTGSGGVAYTTESYHTGAYVLTGGGVISYTVETEVFVVASADALLTGGGVVTSANTSTRLAAVQVTGGGTVGYVAQTLDPRDGTAVLTAGGGIFYQANRQAVASIALTGGGTVAVAPVRASAYTAVLTGGGSVTVVTTAVEPHDETSNVTGGGVVSYEASKQALYAVTLTASGVATVALSKGAVCVEALTGGGIATVASVRSAEHATTLTGAGIVLISNATKGVGSTAALSGGGVIETTRYKGGVETVALTGSGVLSFGSTTARTYAATLTGGGVVSYAVETLVREGTVTLTGAGVITTAPSKGATAALTLTGGGSAVVIRSRGMFGTLVGTGGGVITYDTRKDALATSALTGGGTVTYAYVRGEPHAGSALLTGGGVLTTSTATGRQRNVSLTAAGVVTWTHRATHAGSALLTGAGLANILWSGAHVNDGAVLTGGGVIIIGQVVGGEPPTGFASRHTPRGYAYTHKPTATASELVPTR